jgi:hypothetical protein
MTFDLGVTRTATCDLRHMIRLMTSRTANPCYSPFSIVHEKRINKSIVDGESKIQNRFPIIQNPKSVSNSRCSFFFVPYSKQSSVIIDWFDIFWFAVVVFHIIYQDQAPYTSPESCISSPFGLLSSLLFGLGRNWLLQPPLNPVPSLQFHSILVP